VVGKPAVQAALPTVQALSRFTGSSTCLSHNLAINTAGKTGGFSENCLPELANNLALSLNALDSRKPINYGNGQVGGGAVEPDPRSPGGTGYSGLEGLLEYAFNITNAINTFTPTGHQLAVDVLANQVCSPYADAQSIANNIASYQKNGGDLNTFSAQNPRSCYAFLGPNQPGVTTTDPSNPSACVPDPGGYPVQGYGTHYFGTKTSACKLQANPMASAGDRSNSKSSSSSTAAPTGSGSGGRSSGSPNSFSQTVGQIVSQLSGATGAVSKATSTATGAATGAASSAASATQGGANTNSSSGAQTEQLLNYLLSP
jgi:hypothetical protein